MSRLSDADRPGRWEWTLESRSGDTLSIVIMNTQGEITGRVRSILIQ